MPRSRPAMWSALAMALASTLPTVSLAACGANCSTACAWSAGSPRIRASTRRAFIGVPRTSRALAFASIGVFPSSGLSPAAPVILDVAAEGPRGRELAELVTHHRLGDEHRDVLAAVMNRDGVTEHGRDDHGPPGPGLDNGLGALFVLDVHLFHQVVVDEGPLLQATRHFECAPYRLFLPRRRLISRSLGLFSWRVRPSGLPHGLTGGRPPQGLPPPPPCGGAIGVMATAR